MRYPLMLLCTLALTACGTSDAPDLAAVPQPTAVLVTDASLTTPEAMETARVEALRQRINALRAEAGLPASAPAVVAAEAPATMATQAEVAPTRQFVTQVQFASGSTRMGEADMNTLALQVEPMLNQGVDGVFVIEGFSTPDAKPTAAGELRNMMLALKRAESVRDGLLFLGVPAENIQLHALGVDTLYDLPGSNRRAVVWLSK